MTAQASLNFKLLMTIIMFCLAITLIWGNQFDKDTPALSCCQTLKNPDRLQERLKQVHQTDDGAFVYLSNVDYSASGRKNAVCVSGSRINQLLLPEIHSAMKQHLLNENDPDMFIYGYQQDADVNSSVIITLMEMYGDHLAGFMLKRWTSDDQKKVDLYARVSPGNSVRPVSMFLSIRECHFTLLSPFAKYVRRKPYQVIMRARPEMLYMTPVKMSNYAETNAQELKLYIPPPHNLGRWKIPARTDNTTTTAVFSWGDQFGLGLNDQCAIGGPLAMDLYAMTLSHRLGMKRVSISENTLYDYFVTTLNVKVELADFKYDLLRRK